MKETLKVFLIGSAFSALAAVFVWVMVEVDKRTPSYRTCIEHTTEKYTAVVPAVLLPCPKIGAMINTCTGMVISGMTSVEQTQSVCSKWVDVPNPRYKP